MDRTADLLDEVFAWPAGELGRAVALPMLVLGLIVLLRVAVHLVLPWLGRAVLGPAVRLAGAILTIVVLTGEFVLTQVFRLLWLPLTPVHYAIGDLAVAGGSGARGFAAAAVRQTDRLARFSPILLLAAAVAVVVWWNAGYCGRHPAAGCQAPAVAWVDAVGALW
jgi:hypothetical protein